METDSKTCSRAAAGGAAGIIEATDCICNEPASDVSVSPNVAPFATDIMVWESIETDGTCSGGWTGSGG